MATRKPKKEGGMKMEYKGLVVVTGVNMTPVKVLFKKPNPATIVRKSDGECYKMNAAAGTAVVLAKAGWGVCMTGYHQEILDLLAREQMAEHPPLGAIAADLRQKEIAKSVTQRVLQTKREFNMNVHLVHYGGASDTQVKLPGNTVFGNPWEIPGNAVPELVANNCTTLLNILQAMKEEGVIADQRVTKVVFVSAITALRTKLEHGLDAAQKGAGHALVRSLALDLVPEGIFVTEVMPGITDTGFYDNPKTFESIVRASRALGYEYDKDTFPVFSAERVGEMVQFALEFPGHVREVSAMPYGQYPHLGA
jgi:NADP-dependent 3-hydroxy acid dehydrogenase YdfG